MVNLEFGMRANSKFLIRNSLGAEVAWRPVARAEMLDAHDARRAGRVHELVAADRDADVRRSRIGRREEDDVSRDETIGLHRFPYTILIAHLARQADAVLREDVLREAAAVEPARIAAAVSVRRTAQRQRRSSQGISVQPRLERDRRD